MLRRNNTPQPKASKDADLGERPAKRARYEQKQTPSSKTTRQDAPSASPHKSIPDSEDSEACGEGQAEGSDSEVPKPATRQTDLESALPQVSTSERDAVEEYEIFRASQEGGTINKQEEGPASKWAQGRSSIYVDAFNLALDTVLDEESHLFDEPERAVFAAWRALGYEAQYLRPCSPCVSRSYVRLFLRKTDAWHRVGGLGYHRDVADLAAAVRVLQVRRDLPASSTAQEVYPGDVGNGERIRGVDGTTFTFADSSEEHITSLEEASSLLRLDELKLLAKEAKVSGSNKKDLLRKLRKTSGRQTSLGWAGLKRSNTEDSTRSAASEELGSVESPGEDAIGRMNEASRDTYFTAKIMQETGPCIRLSPVPLKLFERVHLVFYRSSEWTEKSLTTIILAKIARRNFPPYIVSRSASVFPSRSLLLEFEASIRTQFRIDSILESNGPPTQDDLQSILDTFEAVYPRWHRLILEEQQKEDTIYLSGEGAYLRRLSPAWVYTRVVHKAAYVMGLGKFKQHKREHELLTELLTQRLFHPSRRGAWYQRKALLEEHYMGALTPNDGRSDELQKKHWKRIALATCEDALQDPLVHLIYHYDLQKRITKLEKALKVPKRSQHDFAHVRLAAPVEVNIEGVRVEREQPLHSRRNSPASLGVSGSGSSSSSSRRSTRTIWLDPLNDNAECTVEEMCLSHYRAAGWKGYHSEGGIVRTLFAYLFFDVIFSYVPNVFQTPFQTCPLDLHTDAFYPSRLSEINARLAQLGNGEAEPLLRRVWAAHAHKKTCVVGLDWTYELADLVEVVACFEPGALATLCKVLAQEYAARGGGVPDLFLWQVGRREVLFAEVKSVNDRLSDAQRLWIHVLTGAGVRVELCNAVAREVRVGGC
ncbi:hypothetical protein EJ05DRAFT_479655 [Pseudovirgaria hyperparasitica]|uniref:Fanconi-associated nuclease n=1 Tax=Pseudovirgaria hyperparasitica TaxID=470096 RepID=A0A6A6VVB0_9PEZI|nr:uncharacterized protein EJ05DRAFT_479655 [Pseudovirgaria hyperparasitica]KAF2754105.1 hypothetical protein EJ05DRAFT_479655 [Pseudovirgaria hyperparasitica]